MMDGQIIERAAMSQQLESKLARALTVVEEHLQGGWEDGGNGSGIVSRETAERVLGDPDIQNWLHSMRQQNRAPHKRFK